MYTQKSFLSASTFFLILTKDKDKCALKGNLRKSQFFTIRTDPKPVNNLFIFSKLSNEKKKTHGKKTHANVTVTVVRDRKIRTALRTNQIVGFVTVSAWNK